MILPHKLSGWGEYYLNIKCVTVWDKQAFSGTGQMKFFQGKLDFVTDISYAENGKDITVIIYPHNNEQSIMEVATKNEEAIKLLLEELSLQSPDRKAFTVNVEEVSRIEPTMFTRFMPEISSPKDELFYFDSDKEEVGFPKLYIFAANQRKGPYGDVFPVLAMASDVLMPPAGEPTEDGVEFTYNLFHAWLTKHFDGDCPSIHTVRFPSNERMELPKTLNTTALESLLDKSGASKLVVKNGKIVDEADSTKITHSAVKAVEEALFGKVADDELAISLQKDVLERLEVNLSDIYQYGLKKFLGMMPFQDVPVNIHLDVDRIAKKMCAFEGMFYVIPKSNKDESIHDFLEFLGEDTSVTFNFCTEETYPKRLLTGPAPSDIQ